MQDNSHRVTMDYGDYMTIGSIGQSNYTPYIPGYSYTGAEASVGAVSIPEGGSSKVQEPKAVVNPGESTVVTPGRKSSPAQCKTCQNRKYQDGSDEGNVSYKAATHISPESSGAKVMAHEQEHVANAYSKAAKAGGKVLQASVQLKTAICPECGRSFVAGGTTTTRISYPADPHSQNKKSYDAQATRGANFDAAI